MKDRILQYLDDFTHDKSDLLAGELQGELSMDKLTFRQHSQATQSTLLHQYDNFSISTIDAFFQKVIRSFTREAGLVGDYRLEIDQDAVLEQVVENLIDELGSNLELTEWVVDFAKENLENERAWDVRYSLIDFAREIFREEFKEIEDEINIVTSRKDFFKDLRTSLLEVKSSFIREVSVPAQEILKTVQGNGWDAGDFSYGKNSGLFTFIGQFTSGRSLSKFKAPSDRVRGYFSDPLNWPNKKSQQASRIVSLAESTMVPALNRIIDCYDEKFRSAFSAEIALRNMYVFGLITDLSRKLKEYKDENNLMLLADAPKFLNGVIRDSDTPFIYEKVGSFYRNYLIDEFQDTSGLQWKNFQPLIVNSMDQGYSSLVVGDVKQAIYRWRGGDLGLLQEKIISLLGEDRVEIHELDQNFRSAREIVEFNNAFFGTASQILSREAGMPIADRAYGDVAQGSSTANAGFVEITFFNEQQEHESPPVESWKDQALRHIPVTMERLQQKGAALKDIAILVRKNDEGHQIASYLLQYKNSPDARKDCAYDVVSNESLRIDGAASVNLLLGALRYLLNADDSIARAQLGFEFSKLNEPDREPSEVFAVSNQTIFENNLPPAFTRQKPLLKKLPLIELTETLIEIFGLGKITGELVYLQTFQDLVLEFTNRERNDLAAFLEWWETIRHKRSIQVSGEVDAAQILTIHKSKGLQFKYVIIPFCTWNLDHDKWQSPNLWVKSHQGPFASAGYLPVPYGKNLEETFFVEYYTQERAKIFLDNLNLLYVAFTRAEFGLIASAPSADTRAAKGAIAGLLHQTIQSDAQLLVNWNQQNSTFRLGECGIRTSEGKPDPAALRLEEYLMAVAFAELHDLIFDRWAVTRPAAGDLAGIHGRAGEIGADDGVRCLGRAGDGAGDLWRRDLVGQEGERHGRVVGRLLLKAIPIDRSLAEARRSAGLETPQLQSQPIQPLGELEGRGFAGAAGGDLPLAEVDEAVEESAGRQHHGAGREATAVSRHDTTNAAVLDDQILDPALDHLKIGGSADGRLHGPPVQLAVGLGARSLYGRPLGAVEQAELDAGGVGNAAHQAVEGIDLAHQVALAEPANSGIARHLADGGEGVRDKCRTRAHAGSRGRRLTAGMAAAHNDHVKLRFGHRGKIRVAAGP